MDQSLNQNESFSNNNLNISKLNASQIYRYGMKLYNGKMRMPIKNKTPSFGRAGIESHRVEASSGTTRARLQSDSEKNEKTR